MDYIREELLRQQAVLTRLLLGGREREDEEWENDPTREEVLSEEEEVFLNSRKLAALERIRAGRTLTPVQNRFWRDMPEEMAEAAVYRERSGAWVGNLPARSGGRTVSYRGYLNAEAGETAEETLTPVLTEDMPTAAAETMRARELSRIFQRDARRYDGGFTLF